MKAESANGSVLITLILNSFRQTRRLGITTIILNLNSRLSVKISKRNLHLPSSKNAVFVFQPAIDFDDFFINSGNDESESDNGV
jgi:hypothetical protein